jgi:hypothetical protein
MNLMLLQSLQVSSYARVTTVEKLGWIPDITLQEMCKEMVEYDLEQAKQHALLKKHGYAVNISNE